MTQLEHAVRHIIEEFNKKYPEIGVGFSYEELHLSIELYVKDVKRWNMTADNVGDGLVSTLVEMYLNGVTQGISIQTTINNK